MTTTMQREAKATTTQMYRVWIRATPQAIWDAITKPEWAQRYGYQCPVSYDLRPGGAYRALPSEQMKQMGAGSDAVVDGEVIESDPPRKLVQTWRFLWSPELVAEGFTRVTWDIAPEAHGGVTRLTVTHELEGAPAHSAQVAGHIEGAGGGWSWILSDLKSLLETGKGMQE